MKEHVAKKRSKFVSRCTLRGRKEGHAIVCLKTFPTRVRNTLCPLWLLSCDLFVHKFNEIISESSNRRPFSTTLLREREARWLRESSTVKRGSSLLFFVYFCKETMQIFASAFLMYIYHSFDNTYKFVQRRIIKISGSTEPRKQSCSENMF